MNASEMARSLLLAVDPETALGLPRPHAGQQTIIKEPRRFNVIAAGRRWGKNTLAEGQIILPALQGKPVAWFSPTYKTLAEDWRRRPKRASFYLTKPGAASQFSEVTPLPLECSSIGASARGTYVQLPGTPTPAVSGTSSRARQESPTHPGST